MIYAVTNVVLTVLLKVFYRFSVIGRENLGTGPVVVVANHTSYLDPVVIGVAAPRAVYFMAKEELFNVPVLGWYIKQLHAFPVKRESVDRAMLRTALGHLKKNRAVLIFPEGTRSRDDLGEALSGAAFIAHKAGVNIVPAAISGAGSVLPPGAKIPRFPRISVRFGAPIELRGPGDRKALIGQATERMMSEISSMLKKATA